MQDTEFGINSGAITAASSGWLPTPIRSWLVSANAWHATAHRKTHAHAAVSHEGSAAVHGEARHRDKERDVTST